METPSVRTSMPVWEQHVNPVTIRKCTDLRDRLPVKFGISLINFGDQIEVWCIGQHGQPLYVKA